MLTTESVVSVFVPPGKTSAAGPLSVPVPLTISVTESPAFPAKAFMVNELVIVTVCTLPFEK